MENRLKSKIEPLFLLVIISLALFLRIYKLSSIPGPLNRDEASIGYNAYLILMTGKEEHGVKYPLFFESFGDWKKPLYIYLTVPFIWLFGPEIFSVRLLSALAGTFTILIIYLLTKKLGVIDNQPAASRHMPLITALLLAISPWHIHFSRQAYEVNLAIFLISLGGLLFIIRKYPLALMAFILSIYTYHGTILLALMLFAFLIFSNLMKERKTKLLYLLILLLVVVINQLCEKVVIKDKLLQTIVFRDKSVILENVIIPRTLSGSSGGILTRVFPNKYSEGMLAYFENYFNSFSPGFLFFGNDVNERYHINKKSVRLNYIILIPFYLWGLGYVITNKKPSGLIWLFWYLTVPVLPALLVRTPSSFRNLPQVIPFMVFSAIGLNLLMEKVSRLKLRNSIFLGIMILTAVDLIKIGVDYLYRLEDGYDQYYESIVNDFHQIAKKENKPLNLIISHPEFSPYIFVSFYQPISPDYFLKNIQWYEKDSEGFRHAKQISTQYQFGNIEWSKPRDQNTVYVDLYQQVPNNVITSSKYSITYKNKLMQPVFQLVY